MYCLILAVGFYLSYPLAIEQSYTSFQTTLANQKIVSNFLVLQIVECILGLLFCIFLIRDFYKERTIPVFRYFKLFPGFIVLPALFYAESLIFLSFSGISFQLLAIAIALVFPLMIWGLMQFTSWLIPEYDLRLELKFILHILQLILSVVISVKIYALPVQSALEPISYAPLGALLVLLLLSGSLGMLLYQRKMNKLLKSK